MSAKGDPQLAAAVRDGGRDSFAAIAVFRGDVFLNHSAMLDEASVTMLNEFGNAAILLLSPGKVVPLLKDPAIRRIAWFGPQGRLARLDPSMELDMLARFGEGAEGKEYPILARFQDVPGEQEEQAVTAAGFRIVSRAGPNQVLSGPMAGVPRLLAVDRIVYLEKASYSEPGEPRSIPILRPKPQNDSPSKEPQR